MHACSNVNARAAEILRERANQYAAEPVANPFAAVQIQGICNGFHVLAAGVAKQGAVSGTEGDAHAKAAEQLHRYSAALLESAGESTGITANQLYGNARSVAMFADAEARRARELGCG